MIGKTARGQALEVLESQGKENTQILLSMHI